MKLLGYEMNNLMDDYLKKETVKMIAGQCCSRDGCRNCPLKTMETIRANHYGPTNCLAIIFFENTLKKSFMGDGELFSIAKISVLKECLKKCNTFKQEEMEI